MTTGHDLYNFTVNLEIKEKKEAVPDDHPLVYSLLQQGRFTHQSGPLEALAPPDPTCGMVDMPVSLLLLTSWKTFLGLFIV